MSDTIVIDSIVKFDSLHTDDETMWKGKIIGKVKYDIAKSYPQVVPYYMDIKKNNPEIPSIENLEYFIIKLDDDGTGSDIYRAFAEEWIVPGSLITIDVSSKRTIDIYGISETEFADIVEMIKIRGYVVETN
jgi:hypothetical protein